MWSACRNSSVAVRCDKKQVGTIFDTALDSVENDAVNVGRCLEVENLDLTSIKF